MRVLHHPPTLLPPLPPNAPARAVAVLAELHAADRALGMRHPAAPAAPKPHRPFSPDLITRLAHVSTAMHTDYTRHLDTMAVLDEITAALTEHPEFLTSPDCHPGPRLWLRRIAAMLDEPLPGSRWDLNLRAVLPLTEAMLKGSVA